MVFERAISMASICQRRQALQNSITSVTSAHLLRGLSFCHLSTQSFYFLSKVSHLQMQKIKHLHMLGILQPCNKQCHEHDFASPPRPFALTLLPERVFGELAHQPESRPQNLTPKKEADIRILLNRPQKLTKQSTETSLHRRLPKFGLHLAFLKRFCQALHLRGNYIIPKRHPRSSWITL